MAAKSPSIYIYFQYLNAFAEHAGLATGAAAVKMPVIPAHALRTNAMKLVECVNSVKLVTGETIASALAQLTTAPKFPTVIKTTVRSAINVRRANGVTNVKNCVHRTVPFLVN